MNLANQFCYFYDEDAFVDTDRPGFRRRVITGESIQLCFWRIKASAEGSFMHKHDDHEQLGIVAKGRLDFRIGEKDGTKRSVLGANECYLAPRGVWHGDSVFVGDEEYGECWILDVFSPPRDDLREGC